MPLILYFRSPTPNNASDEALVGIRRITTHLNWSVRDIDTALSAMQMKRLVNYWKPLGIIIESGEWSLKIDSTVLAGTPLVFIDRDPSTIPNDSFNILHDAVSAGKVAARELMLTNYRNFAYVPFHERRFWSDERQTGFTESLALNGFGCSVFSPTHVRVDAPVYLRKLRRFIADLPKPCAIFAANDKAAESVLYETLALGLKCPEDVAILGSDDSAPICEHCSPKLSSVHPDFQRGGEMAALMLSAVIACGKRYRGSHTRRYGTVGVTHRTSTRVLAAPTDRETLAAIELIREKACTGLTAEAVLGHYTCSRGPAARRFRQATGHSILDEIHAVQLERVKMLLADKNLQLEALSDFCGFASPHTLRQLFLRKTGMTMSAWRKSHHS